MCCPRGCLVLLQHSRLFLKSFKVSWILRDFLGSLGRLSCLGRLWAVSGPSGWGMWGRPGHF